MRLDLVKGTLDMLILKALAWDSMHGYDIARWLQHTTDDALQVDEGSLYPALHRMTQRGWLRAQWGLSQNNRRAKYYSLTPAGQRQLSIETSTWALFTEAVGKVLRAQQVVT